MKDNIVRLMAVSAVFSCVVSMAPTAGATSLWQNQLNHLDVNNDGNVTPLDALFIVDELNANGRRALSFPEPYPPYVDTSGDQWISPLDSLLVINDLNDLPLVTDQGFVEVTVSAVNASGFPLHSAAVRDEIVLRGFVQDSRVGGHGVYGAYVDLTYDAALVSPLEPSPYVGGYSNVRGGNFEFGRLSGWGGVSGNEPTGGEKLLLFEIPFIVNAPGMLTFGAGPSLETVYVYGLDAPLNEGFVAYGSVSLEAASIPEPGTLLFLASGLASLGALRRRRRRRSGLPPASPRKCHRCSPAPWPPPGKAG